MNQNFFRRDQVDLRNKKRDPCRHEEGVNVNDGPRDRRGVEQRLQIESRRKADQYREREKDRYSKKELSLEITSGRGCVRHAKALDRCIVDRHTISLFYRA